MTRYQCRSCNGIYENKQKSGDYYHICPSKITNPRNENLIIKEGKIKGIKQIGNGRSEIE